MIIPLNVATPLTAATDMVLVPVLAKVPLLSVRVTVEGSTGTGTPLMSWTATFTGGLIATPAAALLGGCVNASLDEPLTTTGAKPRSRDALESLAISV